MAEELRERGAKVAEYLGQMIDFTKQGKEMEAKTAYQRAHNEMVGSGATRYIEKVKDKVGNKTYALPVANAATGALRSYLRYVRREMRYLRREEKRLEKAENKFEKIRKGLEKL